MKQRLLLMKHILILFFREKYGQWPVLKRVLPVRVCSLLVATLFVTSCEVDDFTESVPTGGDNTAPSIAVASPTAGATLKGYIDNEFEAFFSDSDIGLSQAQFVITSPEGETFIDESFPLIGTEDETAYTLIADTLAAGDYILTIHASDTQGKITSQEIEFSVRNPFSEQPMMNMAGSFNGWSNSDNPMDLVDDYMWVTQDSVALTASDEFLFIADPSFDPKFGDGDCDMIAELGGGNIACLYSGTFAVYFNDQTLEYNLEGEVVLASNQDEMFVLGSMNGWGANDPDLQMTLIDNFTWQVKNVSISSGDGFLFVPDVAFSTKWGDAECDNLTTEGGVDILCGFDGVVEITFNDQTLEYSVN